MKTDELSAVFAEKLPILTLDDLSLFMDCVDVTQPFNFSELDNPLGLDPIVDLQVNHHPSSICEAPHPVPPVVDTLLEPVHPIAEGAGGRPKRKVRPPTFFSFDVRDNSLLAHDHRKSSSRLKKKKVDQEKGHSDATPDDMTKEDANKIRDKQRAAQRRARVKIEQNGRIIYLNQLNKTHATLLTEIGFLRIQITKLVHQIKASKAESGHEPRTLLSLS